MEGSLFGYLAVFILGVVCGAIFMRKTGNPNNAGGGGGGLFSRFGRNNNQGMAPRPMQGNMMNQGMQRPGMNQGMGMMNQRPGMMPGQPPMNQPPGGYNNGGYNNPNNNTW